MKKKLLITSLAIGALMTSQLNAQTTKWYFGDKAGLTFNADGTTSPNTNNTAMNSWEGCSAVTDVSGNLLFYADGEHLWNGSSNVEITNTTTAYLLGGASATQAALAVPIPGATCSKFLIFTTPGVENPSFTNGLGASLITVTGTAPSYTVTKSTSQQVVPGTYFSEKLASTNDNSDGYWLVAHNFVQTTGTANTFYAYHLTTSLTSVTTTSAAVAGLTLVTSSVGSNHNTSVIAPPQSWDAQGQMKFSPDGTKLALAKCGSKTVEVFSFNKSTGAIGLLQTYNLGAAPTSANGNIYGLEFSPNGKEVYASTGYGTAGFNKYIYQIDIATSTIATLSASLNTTLRGYSALQLGPNGKIYVAGPDLYKSTTSVINNPDQIGSGCNFVLDAVPVGISGAGTGTLYGLPTVISLSKSCSDVPKQPCFCAGVSVVGTLNTMYENIGAGIYAVDYQINSGGKNIKFLRATLVNWTYAGGSPCSYNSNSSPSYGKIVSAVTGLNSSFSYYPESTDGSIPGSAASGFSNSYMFGALGGATSIATGPSTPLKLIFQFNGQTGSSCTRNIKFAVRFEFVDDNCNLCQVYSYFDPTSAVIVHGLADNTTSTPEVITENKLEKRLQVYPNPNDGSFNIKTKGTGNANYELYNSNGVLQKKGVIEGNKEVKENLKPGVYLIKVIQDNIESTEKIIVN